LYKLRKLPASIGPGGYLASERNEYEKKNKTKETYRSARPYTGIVFLFFFCIVFIVCNAFFIVFVTLCAVFCSSAVLFCVICVFLYIVHYCSTTATG
jgi:hypothetical protein